MKKMYLFFYTTLISIIANAQVLIASYPLDGNANDATGSANGTVNGATLTTDRFGNANSAYYFDGVNSYIEAIADALPTGDNSISVWFNADAGSIAGRPGLLGYGGNTSGSCPGNSDLLIINLSGSGKYVTQAHCLDNYADFTYSSLPENNWYNWVVTKSGTTIKMFINGVLVSTENNATQPVIVSGKKLSIGTVVGPNGFANFTDANVGHFKGKLDDIKIYNGALTDAQIINAYMDNLRKPGSGNAILFDNTLKQIVDVGNGFDQAGSFSFETWVKRTSTAITDINSQTFMASQLNNGWSVGINQSAPADRIYFSKVGISQVVSVSSITDTKWHHVAVTYNSSTNQVVFYIDGIADAPISYSPGGFNSGNTNYRLAGRNNGVNFDNNLNGMLDEVRVWSDVVLTQDEIRGWMCKKINPSHPEYANLQGYFMLDEGSNTVTSGYNGKFGTLINGPTWQTSGASLGDASDYDYTNPTKTANISHASGENFSITSTSGSPAGIQIYRVDAQPNTLAGTSGVGPNDKYFGVFQIGGTTPKYSAVYNYAGNPYVNAGNESTLRLFNRSDNSIAAWGLINTLPNQPGKTITVTGQSTEYILGSIGNALPVTLTSFYAVKQNASVKLSWETENEINFINFIIERSSDNAHWQSFNQVNALNASGHNNYSVVDTNPFNGINLYRLKQINSDGSYKYSNIVRVDFTKRVSVSIFPNPASKTINVQSDKKITGLYIIDMNGEIVKQLNTSTVNSYDISNIASGIYILKIITGEDVQSLKLLIQ